MIWPGQTEYNEAIQNPRTSFGDAELQAGEPTLSPLGMPMPIAGNFAAVYKVHCPATQQDWAVKCFTKKRELKVFERRYRAISDHLERAKLGFMVDFRYLEQGIRILGEWYPILKMRWVEGFTLNKFVEDQLTKPKILQVLAQMWVRLCGGIRASLRRPPLCRRKPGGDRGHRLPPPPSRPLSYRRRPSRNRAAPGPRRPARRSRAAAVGAPSRIQPGPAPTVATRNGT
jgi:hypothetical protein